MRINNSENATIMAGQGKCIEKYTNRKFKIKIRFLENSFSKKSIIT